MAQDEGTPDQPAPEPAPNVGTPSRRPPDEPVLADVSSDEQDVGWGDEPGGRDDEWFRRERPPHHG